MFGAAGDSLVSEVESLRWRVPGDAPSCPRPRSGRPVGLRRLRNRGRAVQGSGCRAGSPGACCARGRHDGEHLGHVGVDRLLDFAHPGRGHRGQRPCAPPASGRARNPASGNALRGPCRRASRDERRPARCDAPCQITVSASSPSLSSPSFTWRRVARFLIHRPAECLPSLLLSAMLSIEQCHAGRRHHVA